ncbi:MAG: hypothetical protein MK066_08880 [Crocinitomicaceae bacterium]|nr:hypothetical protein [Crocinitomicaceae bacterium]
MDSRFIRLQELDKGAYASKKNYLADKGAGFSYFRYRVLRPLLKLRYKWFRKRIESAPWLTITAIKFFDHFLDGSQNGAEFGTGSSTAFFAKRTKHMVSIEHHKGWYEQTKNKLSAAGHSNVDYRLIEKQDPTSTDSVETYFPKVLGLENYEYRKDYINYFCGLDDVENGFFDFIIVDGRARPECVFRSIDKLKSNGLMILDNSERVRYDVAFKHLDSWEMMNTSTGLTDTTFWIKP